MDVLDVVEDFHVAVNAADARSLQKLTTDDIVLAGPHREGRGRGMLEPWLVENGLHLRPLRWFYGGETTVVVEQLVRLQRQGPVTEETLASAFIVDGGKVARCERFVDLSSALSATGLTLRHEVEAPVPPL